MSATPEPDAEEEEDVEEPLAVAISFFGDAGDDSIPLADPRWDRVLRGDDAVCSSINNMLTKARNGGGLGKALRARTATPADESTDDMQREDTTMAKEEKEKPRQRGDLLRLVHEAHEALRSELGRQPTGPEVFDRLGPETAKSIANVKMAMRRLVVRGELSRSASTSGPKPKAISSAKPKPTKRPAPRVVNRGGHATPHVTDKGPLVLSRDAGSFSLRPEIAAKVESDPVLAGIVRRRNELADKVAQLTHVIESW